MPDPSPLNYQSSSDPSCWKDGSLLVVHRRTDLSDRCICCGKRADGRPVTVKMFSSNNTNARFGSGGSSAIVAVILLIIFLFQLIVLLADIVERSNRRILVGLCEQHREREFLFRWGSRLCAAAAVLILGSAFFVWRRDRGSTGQTIASIAVAVVPVLLVLLAWSLSHKRTGLTLSKEAGNVLWISGAGADFLKTLPGTPRQT
jgi:Na+/melibiose symporter-like transporter